MQISGLCSYSSFTKRYCYFNFLRHETYSKLQQILVILMVWTGTLLILSSTLSSHRYLAFCRLRKTVEWLNEGAQMCVSPESENTSSFMQQQLLLLLFVLFLLFRFESHETETIILLVLGTLSGNDNLKNPLFKEVFFSTQAVILNFNNYKIFNMLILI